MASVSGKREGPRAAEEADEEGVKRVRVDPPQELSGEIPIPTADEAMIDVDQTGAMPSTSSSGTSPASVSASAPSDGGVKRGRSGEAMDEEEQPAVRARLSAMIASLHGVDVAEDDEATNCQGNWFKDDWMSSWASEPILDPKMVEAAKRDELSRFARMNVYRVVTRESMENDADGKMISVKWVVTNKGTESQPKAKCRLVAREFDTGDKRGELFAGTPGLMAMRSVISRAMTRCASGAARSIMVADVKTAFLYGDARRSLYIELPPEDPMSKTGQYVGKLNRAMYGTRDAPMIWQDHLRQTLLALGFKESVTHAGVFEHAERDILLCVHVDDLLCAGERKNLEWLTRELRNKYEIETLLLGADDDMEKQATYLGRTLEWQAEGLGMRPDSKHARQLLRDLGMENSRSISTPLCTAEAKEADRQDQPDMPADLARRHRAAVARIVYLAQDRLDLGVAAVELAKTMARPKEGDDARLKRVARYLRGQPEYVQWYPLQDETDQIILTTDADWATCKETRRSNSGGTLQLGHHFIAAWSRVQPRVALSSGEAELYAGVRGLTQMAGFLNLMREFRGSQ